MDDSNKSHAASDIAYRRRSVRVNSAMHGRRHGPQLADVLPQGGDLRRRHLSCIELMASEPEWQPGDAQRVASLAADIRRHGCLRPELAMVCGWHAARLLEIVRQYQTVADLERAHHRRPFRLPEQSPSRHDRQPRRAAARRR